jgi:peptidyl-prolyl cis-trans isomerase SurA
MSVKQAIHGAILGVALGLGGWLMPPLAAQAQGDFSPVVYVNDRVVTQFELDQRRRLLVLFRTTGDLGTQAREQLIEDRLRLFAAELDGVRVTDEQIAEGTEEFAGRANLTGAQLLEVLGQAGVSAETFEDFIRAGQAWRDVVRGRFGPRAQVTEAEVDRAISNAAGATGGVGTLAIEYAQYLVTGRDVARLDRIVSQLDTCDDLYGLAKGEPEDRLTVTALPPADIPAEIRAELDQMDDGEVSTRLTRGDATVVLMLCGRTAAFAEGIDRDLVRAQLVNQRIASYANGYLAELRADAIIREP